MELKQLKTQRRKVSDKLGRLMVLTDPHGHRKLFQTELARLDKAIGDIVEAEKQEKINRKAGK